MIEAHLNLSDVDLMGSGSSLEKMKEVISRLHVKFNNFKLDQKGYESCKSNKVCKEAVTATDSEIVNAMYK